MPSTYVHLSGRDVDGVLLKAHGITVDQESKVKMTLTLTKCPRCGKDSSSEAQFCPACGMVLDLKAAVKLEDERAKAKVKLAMLCYKAESAGCRVVFVNP